MQADKQNSVTLTVKENMNILSLHVSQVSTNSSSLELIVSLSKLTYSKEYDPRTFEAFPLIP